MKSPAVLLVDDNEDCRIIYGSTLRHAGYDVRLAQDGQECLDSVQADPPSLILLDIGMPVMNGMDALGHLRSDPRTASIPVIAVSARVARGQHESVLSAGFVEVLLKPITPGEILSAVRRHVPLE